MKLSKYIFIFLILIKLKNEKKQKFFLHQNEKQIFLIQIRKKYTNSNKK